MAGPLPGLALTEMNKVDLFLPPERCQPPGADQQVHRELQGSSTPSDRVESRVLWSTEVGGKTGFRGSDCNTELGAGTSVFWEAA